MWIAEVDEGLAADCTKTKRKYNRAVDDASDLSVAPEEGEKADRESTEVARVVV